MDHDAARQEFCARCQTIDIASYLVSRDDPSSVELGYFQDILKNDRCLLCKLVIQVLSLRASSIWKPGKYPVEMCHLGRHEDYSNSSQAGLQVWFNATSETLPDGIWGYSTTLGHIQVLEVAPHHNNAAGGRKPGARLVGEQVNVSLVKSWIEDCENHPKCNASISRSVTANINESSPLLLIDVKKMKLAECGWDSRYVALSYVWGRAKQYQTLRSNLTELLEDGSLQRVSGKLSRAISDAIDFVATLGESYLWIDTLCIVQDDMESKARYVSNMDKIYGRALLTIIALAGQDANDPLPGVAPGSRSSSQPPVHLGSFRLLPGLPSLSTAEQKSSWSSRAWAFQEGILSKRRLYFWESQMYWQCSSSYCAENTLGELQGGSMSLGSANALARDTGNDSRLQFSVYESLVKQYSPRKLTYQSDSLKAFAGVLSALGDSFGWSFWSALPENVFDMALLWRPLGGSRLRRDEAEPSGEGSQIGCCDSPTWCWTAWLGFITWDAWRIDWYAGKRIRLISEVADFWVRDATGLHTVTRGQSFGQEGGEAGCGTSLEVATTLERLARDKAPPFNALVFEAVSSGADAFTLSSPLPESSWKMTRPASAYFKNSVRGQLWVYNDLGHHCGTIEGLRSWETSVDVTSYDFILLSRSDQDEITQADVDNSRDRLPLEYFSAEEYYAQVFDTNHFKYKKQWALNILLIKWAGGMAERVAVGQMHVDAWGLARQQRKMIILH